jgi:hypothetical protein
MERPRTEMVGQLEFVKVESMGACSKNPICCCSPPQLHALAFCGGTRTKSVRIIGNSEKVRCTWEKNIRFLLFILASSKC